jgi:hypothetical protein
MNSKQQSSPAALAIRRHRFTAEEDRTIMEYFDKYGEDCWGKLKIVLGVATVRSACERYRTYLDSNSNSRKPFSKEEDQRLLLVHSKYGNKWAYFANNFFDRRPMSLKNRYRILEREFMKGGRRKLSENIEAFEAFKTFKAFEEHSETQQTEGEDLPSSLPSIHSIPSIPSNGSTLLQSKISCQFFDISDDLFQF